MATSPPLSLHHRNSERWSDRIFSTGKDDVFSRSASLQREQAEEEALIWAALQKLPTYDRLRRAVLTRVANEESVEYEEVDVTKLGLADKQQLLEKILRVADKDNERLLQKLRNRIDKVGIDLPKIEVRFEHLNISADVYVGSRALPTLLNFTFNYIQGILSSLRIVPSQKHNLTILHDVSGIIKPSRMTLLLGPPGSGKTTLLLALAGKLGSNLRVSGRVSYNGHGLNEFVPQRTAAYVSQHDVQIGEMTVRETFDFCGRCQGVGSRYDMLMELSRREREAGIKPDPDIDMYMKATAIEGAETSLVTDYILKILGLEICADTLVGDEMRRGISGGEKKRVTTGELLVGPARALFMDEISTGLDSSTTFQIVKCLRQSVHVMDGTMFVSLLQPAPETFELFDDIILLSEGQIVYQGPREQVVEFFEHMGFICPERKSVADFLQEVTSRKDQEQYWADKSKPYCYIPVAEFVKAFSSFRVGQRVSENLLTPYDKSKSHPAALTTQKYGLSKRGLLIACFTREWLLMKRNVVIYVFKTVQISLVAVIAMTLFLRSTLDHDTIGDGSSYLGALFFALINVMFNGFAEISMIVFRLPVFYKQRDMLMYPAWAFSLPAFVMRIPLSLLESAIWVALTYYVIGFAPEPQRFFRQLLVLFLVHQMSLGLFRTIAAVGRNMVVSNTFGTLLLVVVFACGGFVISKDNIPNWWVWGFWVSPLTYGQIAIVVNEFMAPRWDKPNSDTNINASTIGAAILKSRGFFAHSNWYWIGISALCGYIVLLYILFTMALVYFDPINKPQALLAKEATKEKHADQTGEKMLVVSKGRVSSQHKGDLNTEGIDLKSKQPGNDLHLKLQTVSSNADNLEEVDAEAAGVASKTGMILPFQPLSIAFDNISYYVDMPAEMKQHGVHEDRLQLLQDVCGAFRPGVLSALVGISGAGKTTLMDVLAGRKTGGYIEGSISISGYPKKQESFARISGYCEQNDIHSPNLTIWESLIYSAWLRLSPDVDSQTRMMFVDEVMELVELSSIKDGLVGLPGVNGLSTEQRKRLTISVELVANPSIIFMDEPTSGLDARAAAIVMRTVRNTVDTGRTVLCTIHQPSIDIFEAFDELLLLKRGGQVIYSGSLGHQSCDLIQYFERIPGIPKITEGYNPATWMLEISSQYMEQNLGVDFAQIFQASSVYEENKTLIKELSTPQPETEELRFSTVFSQNFSMQCLVCLWKQHKSYWRNPHYIVVKFFFTAVSSLMFGSLYWKLGSRTGTLQDLLNTLGGMYVATLFIGISNSSAVQPVVGVERTVYYRERAAGMYSALPYAFAQAAIEVPYIFLQTLLYGCVVYPMMNFQWTAAKFLWFIFFMFCTFLYFSYYGMMCVAVTPSHHFAAIIASAFYGLWNLFSGFLIPRPGIPVWWRWYYWVCPVAWTLYGLITSQVGDEDGKSVAIPGQGPRIVSEYIKDYFGFHHDFLGVVALMHVVFVVVFALVFGICIKYFNFQNR